MCCRYQSCYHRSWASWSGHLVYRSQGEGCSKGAAGTENVPGPSTSVGGPSSFLKKGQVKASVRGPRDAQRPICNICNSYNTQLDTALHSAPRTAEVTCSVTCNSIDLRQLNFQCLMAQVPTYTTLLQPAQETL